MERLKALMDQYGGVALGVYLSTSAVVVALVFLGFSAFGAEVQSGTGFMATAGTAWLALKATQIPRIMATLAATPVVAKVLKREKKSPLAASAPAEVSNPPK